MMNKAMATATMSCISWHSCSPLLQQASREKRREMLRSSEGSSQSWTGPVSTPHKKCNAL